ncbi:phage tail protein [Providencia stuartii]|uniref:phage tail protein n=1 Tax=Providencia stuartii TaxID=588 RepID=UPI00300D8C36
MKNPKLITKPFAQNGQKNAIPENFSSSMESNQATWDQGFGQITMIPVAAGGLPPKGQDFNGIFNQISENVVHLSKGGRFKFSADYAAAINGYPKGAILQSDDEKKEYQSIIDNNKVNFNTATQAQINAAWKLFSTDDMLQQLAGKQPAGDYATNAALNNGLNQKFDKTAIVQSIGTSTTQVMSQDAATKVFLQQGAFGLGASVFGIAPPSSMNANEIETSGFYGGAGSGGSNWFYNTGPMLTMIRKGGGDGSGTVNQLQCSSRELAFRIRIENQWSEWINTLTSKNTLSDRNGNLKLLGASELSDCQVGIPLPWPQATAPAGYLICNGQSFNKTAYPLLAKAYPSGQLPDLRGEFIRGLDAGRNVDSGRAVLSSQLDQMQRITGQTLAGATYSDANFIGGAFSFKNELTVPNYPSTDRTEGSGKVYFDSATSPNARVSKDTTGETRPRNIAFLYIVRAA